MCYNAGMSFHDHLPVDDFREAVLRALSEHPVLILTAETGAGKSTRVPWWLWRLGKRVCVTQPRRIAARALSQYVAQGAGVEWGAEIGYQTGFDARRSPATRLLYVTDGVQMAREVAGRRDYDVLVLDEIHEWNLNQEILIGLVKENLSNGFYARSGKRVVVMSATMKAPQLAAFLDHAPILDVPGRLFPVSKHQRNPCFFLPDAAGYVEEGRNLLVFQPGKQEIEDFGRELRKLLEVDRRKVVILPLHAEISIKEQSRVFERYDHPKVVVATDIAQTSLTIDDIDVVLDSGVKKEVRLVNGIEGLYPTEISAAECQQRAGRAGRVKEGVYILFSEIAVIDRPDFPEPEIRRLNPEAVVLRMLLWGVDPLTFSFFHRPKRNLILKAMENLRVFGALDENNRITEDGRRMAELPVAVRSSRLLLEAGKGGPAVLDRALKLIAIYETRGITNREFNGEKYLNGPYRSDLLNQLALWETHKKNRRVVSFKKMQLAREIYTELRRRLKVEPVTAALTAADLRALYRAVLSTFVDSVYFRSEGTYLHDGEERLPDRTSLLQENRPEMITGMPFDLAIQREDPRTGQKEERSLQLLTFCSELSPALLEELQPFSYRRERRVEMKGDQFVVVDNLHFGGRLLKAVEVLPDWENAAETAEIVELAVQWALANYERLGCRAVLEKNRAWLVESAAVLGADTPEFEPLLRRYLRREMTRHLRIQDLEFFFRFHPGFFRLTLKQLLPPPLLHRLRQARWPQSLTVGESNWPVVYRGRRPFIQVTMAQFAVMRRDDLQLPGGEIAGVSLEGKPLPDWAAAVSEYDERLKREVFERNWGGAPKAVRMADVVDLPFPVAFNGGNGKEGAVFEFHTAPQLVDDGVVMRHFFTADEAGRHFAAMQTAWEEARQRFKRESIAAIFRDKGWKVK